MKKITLKKGREKPVLKKHPWIFSGAIKEVDAGIIDGEIIELCDYSAEFLAYGYYNSKSQISIRLLEWNKDIDIDDSWWGDKIKNSISRRDSIIKTDSYRLIFSEADYLPGLIVDKYGDYFVMQVLTAGIERVKQIIVNALLSLTSPSGIYERSDSVTRELEGLEKTTTILFGDSVPGSIIINENDFKFAVNLKEGQKTGFFLDQRRNRETVANFSKGRRVLDCFSYSGAFSVYSLAHGAESSTLVDSSKQALGLAQKNLELNNLSDSKFELVNEDVFKTLRKFRDCSADFDLIILDPPKLAPTRAQRNKALRAYKDINLLGMKLLTQNGILATFSCSGGISQQDFRQIIFNAARDANREVQILTQLSQGSDHPIRLSCPETEYLKGVICRVI
jgi:23S rRNA (cytosine1962-C5)-methyltransferase